MLTVFTVNTNADDVDHNIGDGICMTASGRCTPRAAIQESNVSLSNDVIKVPFGYYRLGISGAGEDSSATGDLDVTKTVGTLTIDGQSLYGSKPIIDANTVDRVMQIFPNVSLHLNSVMIVGGVYYGHGLGGGGIANSGTLKINDSIVMNNASSGGAGIYNAGFLGLTNSAVSGNGAIGHGGGIYNDQGTITVHNCTIEANSASLGGGIFNNRGILALDSGSKVIGNLAFFGGGIYNDLGAVEIDGGSVSYNTAIEYRDGRNPFAACGGYGGGIYNDGTLTIKGTGAVEGNAATYENDIKNEGVVNYFVDDLFGSPDNPWDWWSLPSSFF